MEQPQLSSRLSGRVSEAVGGIRDRTAEALSTDGASVFRALSDLRHSVAELDDTVRTRLDDIEGGRAFSNRTTMPRKLFWLLVGAAAGTAAAYLGDADRGRSRRAEFSQQLAAKSRDASDQLSGQAKAVANRVKGEAIESAKERMPDDVPDDPHVLEQRIRSHVFGYRSDVNDVVLRVDAPGVVALKGTVPTSTSEQEIVSAVSAVDGVIEVKSELVVGS